MRIHAKLLFGDVSIFLASGTSGENPQQHHQQLNQQLDIH
jgi:hypothetical protein